MKCLKGQVDVISRDLSFKDGHGRFATVPFRHSSVPND